MHNPELTLTLIAPLRNALLPTTAAWFCLETDIKNARGTWVDLQMVVHDNIITSRKPGDLDAFSEKLIAALTDVLRSGKR